MKNIIDEYLVSIGFEFDKSAMQGAKTTLNSVGKAVKELALPFKGLRDSLTLLSAAFAAATGALAAFALKIGSIGRTLGNITMEVDRFALSLYTTTRNARNLKTVMDAMGIDSLEDLKYINLIPEQRKQFLELRQLASQLAPDQETQKGLNELKKIGFQFQKMQVEMQYIGLKLLGTFGNLMASPLFRKIPGVIQVIMDILAYLANVVDRIAKKIGAHPVESAAGGLAGGVAGGVLGRSGGAAIGGAVGSLFGPIGRVAGTALGGLIGGVVGTGVGAPVGAGAAASLAEGQMDTSWRKALEHLIGKPKQTSGKLGGGKRNIASYKAFAREMADKYGVDPAVLQALITQESGWNPKARSSVGALGIAQFMPRTARSMGVDPLDPYSAIDGAARYLKNAIVHYKGNLGKALASYNAGFGAVDDYSHGTNKTGDNPRHRITGIPPYAQTINYVKSITALSERIRRQDAAKPNQVSVLINVSGAQSPIATANAIENKLSVFFNTRSLQGLA